MFTNKLKKSSCTTFIDSAKFDLYILPDTLVETEQQQQQQQQEEENWKVTFLNK